jgi:tripartite-type tricarboxylate transporter receptor subunit TctC
MKKLALVFALTLFADIAGVHAQGFPSRPVTLIVPFPPGGSTDTAARILGERMRAPLGQTVVIENVGGTGGSIAAGRVARATPDGYTIDIGQWDTHVGSIICPLNYDLQKDFEPIGLLSINPQLIGQVDLMVVQAAVTLPQARTGAVKILANLSPARSSVIPTIPTSAESGIPGLYAYLGLDVATRERQTPEGLAAFHKGEIEKWWPIIKAAGIKVE